MSFKLRNARERYQILHFIFSKNVKIGIKCSIAVPDSPQKDKQRHWKTMALFFSHLYYFRFSKNVKIGIKCSFAVHDSPQN